MKAGNRILLLSLCGVLLAVLIVWFADFKKDETQHSTIEPAGYHQVNFFEEKIFFDEILRSDLDTRQPKESVVGGVIPHHLLASDIIHGFFEAIAGSESIERVVLIGPNHYERGDTVFITSKYGWETPMGNVLPDLGLIEEMDVSFSSLGISEEVIKQEHSIAGIMPFIAYYLPNARVVPISISRQATLPDLKSLADFFKVPDGTKTLFIASVDFSHYLSLGEAEEKDVETLKILRRGDLKALLRFDEANTDSPESLALLLLIMDHFGVDIFEVKSHKNSADYTGETEAETTSYYSLIFKEQ